MAPYQEALAADSCGPQALAPSRLALTDVAAQPLCATQAQGCTTPKAQQPDCNAAAPSGLPMGLSNAQQEPLTPQLLANGNTLYPGETTQIQHEPLIDLQAIDLPEAGQTPPHTGHHPDAAAHVDARLPDLFGNPLEEYIDPATQEAWLCHPGHNDMVCWLRDYTAYLHPAIGITQIEANALAAADVARRAAEDATYQANVAQAAEMRATALAKVLADKAEADLRDKEAAAAIAATTADKATQRYDVAAAQASADASHRAHRLSLADTAATPPAIAEALTPAAQTLVPSAPASLAAAGREPHSTDAPAHAPPVDASNTVPALAEQALQATPHPAPAIPRVIPAGPAPGIFDRLGRSIACYAHAGSGHRQ